MAIVLNDYPVQFLFVRVCIWVLGFYRLEVVRALMGSLLFGSLDCAKLLCF